MAEKEERIIIAVAEPSLLEGGADKIYPCMTRQEAINRIAKAICQFEMMTVGHICKECTEDCTDHLEMEVVDKAEAALNALLEK